MKLSELHAQYAWLLRTAFLQTSRTDDEDVQLQKGNPFEACQSAVPKRLPRAARSRNEERLTPRTCFCHHDTRSQSKQGLCYQFQRPSVLSM